MQKVLLTGLAGTLAQAGKEAYRAAIVLQATILYRQVFIIPLTTIIQAQGLTAGTCARVMTATELMLTMLQLLL